MASNGCIIFAKDIAVMSEFYRTVLNLSVSEEAKGHHVLNSESLELVIHGIPKSISDNIDIETPPKLRASTPMKPCFVIESLDDVRTACESTNGGLKPVKAIWEIRGAKVLDGWDPEGNIIQFKELIT